MREQCNWRNIGIFIVITMCLVSMMSPAMTQSSNVIPSTPLYMYGPVFHDNLPDLEVNEIDIANVTNVTLFSVVNWGFQTDLWFNGHLLGKDCFTSSIHPYQEEIVQYNVTMIPAEYLNSTYNLVEMEFRGNCRNIPTNALLVVEYKKDER